MTHARLFLDPPDPGFDRIEAATGNPARFHKLSKHGGMLLLNLGHTGNGINDLGHRAFEPAQPLLAPREPLFDSTEPLFDTTEPLLNPVQVLFNAGQPLFNRRQPLVHSRKSIAHFGAHLLQQAQGVIFNVVCHDPILPLCRAPRKPNLNRCPQLCIAGCKVLLTPCSVFSQ